MADLWELGRSRKMRSVICLCLCVCVCVFVFMSMFVFVSVFVFVFFIGMKYEGMHGGLGKSDQLLHCYRTVQCHRLSGDSGIRRAKPAV